MPVTTTGAAGEMKAFLALCLDPPGREPRTPEELARVMPPYVADEIAAFAPHLGELRKAADAARDAYVTALREWITETTESETTQ
ncbi:hypothetical protein ACFWVB_02640 [Streptomyces microflavus]|uniref:hypothetical protein n=1 Tax=Streptomyces microflavus TaxID=1919 RepID=UPI003658CF1B